MKHILLPILLVIVNYIPSLLAQVSQPLVARMAIIGYSHDQPVYAKGVRIGALGTELRNTAEYTSAAADWSYFPAGTVFKIRGAGNTRFVVDDHAPEVTGKRAVKIYFASGAQKRQWGARQGDIEILSMGDEKASYLKLREQSAQAHCYQMAKRLFARSKEREEQIALEQVMAARMAEYQEYQNLRSKANWVPANTSAVEEKDLPMEVVDPVEAPDGASSLFPLMPLPKDATETVIQE